MSHIDQTLAGLISQIQSAQRLRGWNMRTLNPVKLFRRSMPLTNPLMRRTAMLVDQVTTATQIRGFGSGKVTPLRDLTLAWLDKIIILLMLIVAGFNMISGLLILILEKTNMIGILKALGSDDITIRSVFLYQAAWLIGKGLLWGNIAGIGLALLQLKTGLVTLDPSSYYIKTVPVNLELIPIILLNAGTMAIIIIMLLVPSKLISRITPVKAIRYD